jgi:hypothetical protein
MTRFSCIKNNNSKLNLKIYANFDGLVRLTQRPTADRRAYTVVEMGEHMHAPITTVKTQ